MTWLAISVGLSILLTVMLNVVPRLFPGAGRRVSRKLTETAWPEPGESRPPHRQIRVWAPWKAMILGSVILTIAVNLLLWFSRG